MEIRQDAWLAERFGHAVFTLTGLDAGLDRDALRRHAERQEAATYQAKVPSPEVGLANELCDAGFRVICTGVTMGRATGAPALEPVPGEPEVRELDPERDAAVPELTSRAIWRSRFHLDPSIPDEVARRVKRDWAAAHVAGTRGEGSLAVELEGRPVGYLGGITAGRTRVIDLIAVDPDVQSRGAGRALVRRFLETAGSGFDAVEAGTQAANDRAIRWYERLGFQTVRTVYDLHMHVGSAWKRR